MNILAKRMLACGIDMGVFAVLVVAFQLVLPTAFAFLGAVGSLGYAVLLIPYVCKDLLFRHASLGKKLVGITVVDMHWSTPSAWTLIKRAAFTLTVGYVCLIKAALTDKSYISLFDRERDVLHTFVVDCTMIDRLRDEASRTGGEAEATMTQMYCAHLRELYMK